MDYAAPEPQHVNGALAMNLSTKNILRLSLAIGALVVGGLAAVLMASQSQGKSGKVGGDFSLNSVDGEVSLSDFRGKVVVLYFGFTECHEVCPTSMGVLRNTLQRLSETELNQLQSIFVSVDPARDTAQKIADFTSRFHPTIIGVRGSSEQVEAVANQYHAYFKQDEVVDETDYKFRHSSRFYIVNQNGILVDAMRHSTTSNELLARVKQLIYVSEENKI